MAKFVWIGVVAQLVMVVAGHFNETVLNLSGILGTGIPFVLGVWYGVAVPRSRGEASKGGFVIGIVGAVVGVVVAILMGDQPWVLLSFAPLSSAVTGILGAILGLAASGRRNAAEA